MLHESIDRRRFLYQAAAGAVTLSAGLTGCEPKAGLPEENQPPPAQPQLPQAEAPAGPRLPYKGPNVILVRFGGGVRRLETIQAPEATHCPFLYHELYKKRGFLFNNIDIASTPGIDTRRFTCSPASSTITRTLLVSHLPTATKPRSPRFSSTSASTTMSRITRPSSSTARTASTRNSTPSAITTCSACATGRRC